MEASDSQVSRGTARAAESNAAMADIQKSADALYQHVKAISSLATEIADQSNEMTSSIEEIASVSEENTAATEEVNASAEEISGQMDEMGTLTQFLAEMALTMKELVVRSARG